MTDRENDVYPELSDQDRRIVEAITADISEENRPYCIAIHKDELHKERARKRRLLHEIALIDRAIAMRQYSLERLMADG